METSGRQTETDGAPVRVACMGLDEQMAAGMDAGDVPSDEVGADEEPLVSRCPSARRLLFPPALPRCSALCHHALASSAVA